MAWLCPCQPSSWRTLREILRDYGIERTDQLAQQNLVRRPASHFIHLSRVLEGAPPPHTHTHTHTHTRTNVYMQTPSCLQMCMPLFPVTSSFPALLLARNSPGTWLPSSPVSSRPTPTPPPPLTALCPATPPPPRSAPPLSQTWAQGLAWGCVARQRGPGVPAPGRGRVQAADCRRWPCCRTRSPSPPRPS